RANSPSSAVSVSTGALPTPPPWPGRWRPGKRDATARRRRWTGASPPPMPASSLRISIPLSPCRHSIASHPLATRRLLESLRRMTLSTYHYRIDRPLVRLGRDIVTQDVGLAGTAVPVVYPATAVAGSSLRQH